MSANRLTNMVRRTLELGVLVPINLKM